MPRLKHQKGTVHLGILGLLVLTGGLFAASRLASNPDLTFFNIVEQAKGIIKNECLKNGKSIKCLKKPEKATKKNTQTAADLPPCKKDVECTQNKIQGLTACDKGGVIYYCRDTLKKCTTAGCSEDPVKGADRCQDSRHPNGWNCCPKGRHVLTDALGINVCSSLAGNPPPCPANVQCSNSYNDGSLCFKTEDPDTAYYCK